MSNVNKGNVSSPINRGRAGFTGSQRSGKYTPNLHPAYPVQTSKPNIHLPSRYNNVHVDTTSLACVTSGNRSETTSVMFLRSEVFETSGMSSESKSLTLLNWKCSCKMPCMTEGSSEFCHFQVSYLQIGARQGASKLTLSNVLLNPRSRFAL